MQLNELAQDALCELFNIGVGAAADVLSQMVHEEVHLSVPVVDVFSQEDANRYFLERVSRPLCAIRQTYVGDVTTDAVLMFPEEKSLELVRAMVGNEVSAEALSDMELDAMAEIGNIILNAVISSLSRSLGLAFDGALPEVTIIDAQGVFSDVGRHSDDAVKPSTVLALTIDFSLASRQINGYLAFLLDLPSSENLLSSLQGYVEGL